MSLKQLSVPALHRFDVANSRLRHSIVEACFYNLRMLSQELPGKRGDSRFMHNLDDSLAKIGSARKLIEEYFEYQVRGGLTVAELFPERHGVVETALAEIERLAREGPPAREETAACERFADAVVTNVDAVLDAIDRIRRRVNDRRIEVGRVLEDLVLIHRSACDERGVRLEFHNDSDGEVRAFADGEQLLNALGELVRNALRHGFPEEVAEDARIEIGLGVDPDTRDILIDISDNGCGMPPERLEMIGAAGASTTGGGDGVALVRQVVEKGHCGRLGFESEPGNGTRFRVRLLRRAEPELEPGAGPRQDSRPTLVRKRPGRAARRRKRLARLVAYGMTTIGAGAALWFYAVLKDRPIVVAADGSGDYVQLARAIAVAPENGHLIVRPGEYPGPFAIDKSLTVSGAGSASDVILRSSAGATVHLSAGAAVLRNLRIVHDDRNARSVAVLITGGRPTIENCVVESEALSAVEVSGAAPTVRRCAIRSARHSGLLLHNSAGGRYLQNRIEDCGGAGVTVADGAAPELRDNAIARCGDGIRIDANVAGGTYEGNEMTACRRAGMIVGSHSSPAVRRNGFAGSAQIGLWLLRGATGSYEENRFVANEIAGIVVEAEASPDLRGNVFEDHKRVALWLKEGAAGSADETVFENNARNVYAEPGTRTRLAAEATGE